MSGGVEQRQGSYPAAGRVGATISEEHVTTTIAANGFSEAVGSCQWPRVCDHNFRRATAGDARGRKKDFELADDTAIDRFPQASRVTDCVAVVGVLLLGDV